MDEQIADLQISLRRREQGVYALEMRFTQPGNEVQVQVGINESLSVNFDFTDLLGKIGTNAAYAASLTESLFAPALFRQKFAEARASAQNNPLRIRLQLDYSDPDLNRQHWEALLDPETSSPLFTGDLVYFSRYLSSFQFRRITARGKRDLRALLTAAGPDGLGNFQLDAVDVEKELKGVAGHMGEIAFRCLPGIDGQPAAPAPAERCSLVQLSRLLRQGVQEEKSYDVLYLVCHGIFAKGEPYLFLEDETGGVARVSGTELVRCIADLAEPPRLVVLASCESAKENTGAALTALGPLLAKAGVPAVIAMQGQISMDTVATFMPVLFAQLNQHGRIDHAMAVARGEAFTRKRPDYWMPVLYMRLESGRVWKPPSPAGAAASFEQWPALLRRLRKKTCTPFIGPGVLTGLVGSPRDIAAEWSTRYGYPLRPYERTRLPQVAQFVLVQQNEADDFLSDTLVEDMRRCVQERFAGRLPPNLQQKTAALDAILEHLANERAQSGRVEPHHLLTKFELPVYI
ncbi:MAG: CHAT domain-containing protein, partial [Anaerolineaceae bacterium]|nr:CHAT domain-containing protein [Anaerolineaceae bacterium]